MEDHTYFVGSDGKVYVLSKKVRRPKGGKRDN